MKDDFPRYTLRISQILLDKIGYIANTRVEPKIRKLNS